MFVEKLSIIQGEYRILFADNTPEPSRNLNAYAALKSINRNVDIFVFDSTGSMDGETHGQALDYLINKSDTNIVGTMDYDFFWLRPDILEYINRLFIQGYEAVGCAGWYPDFQRVIDQKYPERAGSLAPVVWGQFLKRELAVSETFVSTYEEGFTKSLETGWRLRKKIIDNDIPSLVFSGFKYPFQNDENVCWFGEPEKPVGLHILKGTHRAYDMNEMSTLIDWGSSLWH